MSKNKISILETIRQGKIGGGESHLMDLVANLNRDFFEPTVLSFTHGPMVDKLRALGITCEVIYTEKAFDFSVWRKVKRFLVENKIHIVHAHGTRANSNINWAARSLGIPVVYTIHGWSFHPDQNFLVKKLRIFGEHYLTSKSRVNISVSDANQREGQANFDFHSKVIKYGIDSDKFRYNRVVKDVRAELGISPDKVLYLFIARFTSHKQPLSLVKAFAKVSHDKPAMHLLMVGDGDQKEAVIKLIKQLGLELRVTLDNFRNDVPDVLACADIFVLPSLWEGLPIGLLEAMMMGKAIIASNVDGTGDIITDGENGLLVDTENLVENLIGPMTQLYANRAEIYRLGESARKTVIKDYNVIDMTKKIEAVYQKIYLGEIS